MDLTLSRTLSVFVGGPGVDDEILSWILESHPALSYRGKKPVLFPLDVSWYSHPKDQVDSVKELFDDEDIWRGGPWILKCFSPFVLRAVEYYTKKTGAQEKVDYFFVECVGDYDLDKLINGSESEMRSCFKIRQLQGGPGLDPVWKSFSEPMNYMLSI